MASPDFGSGAGSAVSTQSISGPATCTGSQLQFPVTVTPTAQSNSPTRISRPSPEDKERNHTCPVCLELFSEPKVLPCCHTFCLKCLEKTARSGQKKVVPLRAVAWVGQQTKRREEITCPQCRKTHIIPAGGLTEFLTDFIMSHEIEVKKLKSPSTAQTPRDGRLCGECEQQAPIQAYCCDCRRYLCSDCIHLHKKLKSFRGHATVPIEDLDAATLQSSQTQYCTKHKSEPLKLFCNTCQKVVCRDCTLVDHRQHDYMFAEDARKTIESRVKVLGDEVAKKFQRYKTNFREIEKVERSAVGYSEVLKANINTFFDNLARSVEARRQQLLMMAEAEGQKDMKQIWADKNFHETAISQMSSVFDLIGKARKCTSDVEMILTALQGIRQLTQIKEMEWDKRAFAGVVTSPTKFTDGLKMTMSKAGNLERSSVKTVDLQVCSPPVDPQLGSTASFVVKTSDTLVDGRSGEAVYMSTKDLRGVVKYGKSQKPLKTDLLSLSRGCSGSITINIRLVCGGKHTVIFNDGQNELTKHSFSFSVKGQPKRGDRVKQGPDYEMDGKFEGAVTDTKIHYKQAYDNNPYYRHGHYNVMYGHHHQAAGIANGHCVHVNETSANGQVVKYKCKWGQDGIYEVELV